VAENQVSWQTAYWGLVAFAVSAMIQPAGRFLSFDPALRFFLRSSPVLCLGDLLALLVLVVIGSIEQNSLPRGVLEVLIYRGHIPHNADGIPRPPQEVTWARLLVFVMVALPAGLKLFSPSGLPWTQCWGYCFFISWTLYELIAAVAPHIRVVQPPDRRRVRRTQHLRIRFQKYDYVVSILAGVAQYSLSTWALWSLPARGGVDAFSTKCEAEFPHSAFYCALVMTVKYMTAGVVIAVICLPPPFLLVVVADMVLHRLARREYHILTKPGKAVPLFLAGLLPLLLIVSVNLHNVMKPLWLPVSSALLMVSTISLCCFAITRSSRRFPMLNRLVLREAGAGREEITDSALCFSALLALFTSTTLWYAFEYNPGGTSKHGWTAALGD
jgi:hypothetical protein